MKRMQQIGSRCICTLMCVVIGICILPVHAQECEPHWSDEFPSGELNHWVWAITEFDDGSGDGLETYVSGYFTEGSGRKLNRIARLDGSNNGWARLGEGADGYIYTMAVFDDGQVDGEVLYAAGTFTTVDGIAASNIAKWDGTNWSTLSEGLNSYQVRSLYTHDDGSGVALYAGGYINEADGTTIGISRWDGKTWTSVGGGVNDSVRTMVEFDDGSGPALFVGGTFTTAGGIPANKIAKWDGETWLPLGDGVDLGFVRAMTVFDDGSGPALYVGGSFDEAGGAPVFNIAKWDGKSWSALGAGTDNIVHSLAVFDDGFGSALYVGGYFENAGGIAAKGLARWDGSEWFAVGPAFGNYASVLALTVVDNPQQDEQTLCVGGHFSQANYIPLSNFAKWNGSSWSGAGNGLNGDASSFTNALAVVEKDGNIFPGLYTAGWIAAAGGGIPLAGIAHWNGEEWASVGEVNIEPDFGVLDIKYFDLGTGSGPVLYAAGVFQEMGGQDANYIAKWNGVEWSPLGTGLSSIVTCMTAFEDFDNDGPALFAGGWFTEVGEQTFNRIARWDGSEWFPLGAGMNDWVLALTIFDDGSGNGPALYAGGRFTAAGKVNANYIAKWDGIQWSSLGEGTDSRVYTLTVYDDGSGRGPALYAGGSFSSAGGIEVQGIARWDRQQWSAIGDWKEKDPPHIRILKVLDDGITSNPALYFGGYFQSIGGIKANNIARWDGQSWSTFGTGFEPAYQNDFPHVLGLEIFDDGSIDGPSLFAVGDFDYAGGHSSQNIAKWVICNDQIPGDLNGDGVVGTSDLLILLSSWGPCDDCNNCVADLDDNCTVGTSDLLILLSNWG